MREQVTAHRSTLPTKFSNGKYWPEWTPRRCPAERGVWRGADHSLFLRSSPPLC